MWDFQKKPKSIKKTKSIFPYMCAHHLHRVWSFSEKTETVDIIHFQRRWELRVAHNFYSKKVIRRVVTARKEYLPTTSSSDETDIEFMISVVN